MPRKIKVVSIENEIVATPDPITDIPNDDQVYPDPPDEPIVIPEENVNEILEQNEIDNNASKEHKTGNVIYVV